MTPQEREQYWLNRMDEIRQNEAELIRLLKLTRESKSLVVMDLRTSIISYVNTTEKYIADIEIDNAELGNLALSLIELNNENCELMKKHIKSFRNVTL